MIAHFLRRRVVKQHIVGSGRDRHIEGNPDILPDNLARESMQLPHRAQRACMLPPNRDPAVTCAIACATEWPCRQGCKDSLKADLRHITDLMGEKSE